MSNLIVFAEEKDALGFQAALHEAIAEKVSFVLNALRETVATDLFGDSYSEVESLEELKKSTLASYVKKAVEKVDTDSYNTGKNFHKKPGPDAIGKHHKYLRRRQGINRAVTKLAT